MSRNGEIKDYYRVLEVSSVATLAEIKSSYRRLAFKFHPDTNPDNQFAIAMFREIQEAYHVLSDINKRRRYDEERWISGMGNRLRDKETVSARWIHIECRKLHAHMAVVDTYRMDHLALYEYIRLILSDGNKAVLLAEGDRQANLGIAYLLLGASKSLRHPYMELIAQQLRLICEDDNFTEKLEEQVKLSKVSSRNNKYMPVIVIAIALLLCVFMYLWSV